MKGDLESVVFIIAVLILFILFGGEPDLGDALQQAIRGEEVCGK